MVKFFCLAALMGLAAVSQATNLHVNKGYITVGEDSPVKGSINVSPPVTIYAMFKGNQDGATAKPKCSLEADWPSSYGDVYFGADNCLYDSNGQNINSQCCKMSNDLPEVANPYH